MKTINLYYNNRSVQSVVELKNKPALWQKAKKCHLIQGQTDLKIDFPLPIVACNLMVEYADFYENIQASSETLQCPRCSAAVPATPGVCGNCGENVYQCHKCRYLKMVFDHNLRFLILVWQPFLKAWEINTWDITKKGQESDLKDDSIADCFRFAKVPTVGVFKQVQKLNPWYVSSRRKFDS